MKILITSDNHVGYKESDPIRGSDSFNTFEEILQLANQHDVDLILQGGDLFHENRPSRNTIAATIALIKNYTLGNKEIKFVCNKKMNYEDPNMNIAVPILCIHGNHDDPTGIFTKSALDILESTNLINYGGRVTSLEQIEIEPWIFDNKVAIYLLGNIRDRRLYHLFVSNNVKFKRPKEQLVNILVVHQNRVQYAVKDYLPYEFLPDWFDLVVYGHEHESLVMNLQNFILMQPGSTVRTSLAKHESFDKFVYLVETDGLKIEKILLKTVRPFFILDCEDLPADCENFLREKVFELIGSMENNEFIDEEHNIYVPRDEEPKRIKNNSLIPLVRIRGKIKDNTVINNYKFGIHFKDKVANYNEILQLTRPRKKKLDTGRGVSEEKTEFYEILMNNLNCLVISESKFIKGLKDYVEKDEKEAFTNLVKETYTINVERLGCDKNDILERMESVKKLMNLEEEVGNLSEIKNENAFTDLL